MLVKYKDQIFEEKLGKEFQLEKELQSFFEENLESIIGYKFLDTEFMLD